MNRPKKAPVVLDPASVSGTPVGSPHTEPGGFFVQFTPVSRPSVTDITEGGLSHGLSLTCLSPTPFFWYFSPHPALAQQHRDRAALTPVPCPRWGGLRALGHPHILFRPPQGSNLSGMKKTITETGQTHGTATQLPPHRVSMWPTGCFVYVCGATGSY